MSEYSDFEDFLDKLDRRSNFSDDPFGAEIESLDQEDIDILMAGRRRPEPIAKPKTRAPRKKTPKA